MQSITSGQPVSSPIEIKGTASLKNGQILFGKVNKVFPNQTAEIQIGHQKMIATLDIPLRTGEKYWFQVQHPIEGKVVLKALDSPDLNISGLKGTAAQLIAHLGITPEPAATKLAEYLLTNSLPITKETFQSALQWLKTADAAEVGLPVIKTMFIQQLPFVKDVFDALFTQSKGEPFHKLLSGFKQQLQDGGPGTRTAVKLMEVLDSLRVAKQNQLQQIGLQKLVTTWLNSDSTPEMKSGAFSLLQKTGFVPKEITESVFLEILIDGAEARSGIPKNSSIDKLHQGLQLLSEAKRGAFAKVEEIEIAINLILNSHEHEETKLPIDVHSIQRKNISAEKLSPLAFHLLQSAFFEAAAKKAVGGNIEVNDLIGYLNKNTERVAESKGKAGELLFQSLNKLPEAQYARINEKLVLSHVLDTEFQTFDFTNGPSVAHQLKEMTKILGLQLEHALINLSGDNMAGFPKDLETLKPLLLKLLNEQIPASIKEMAEQILNRITAQQILSQENGPIQNLLLTLPLNLGSTQTDLTIQWSGRKTKDGKIDPDYCRVLFYLELERIKETVIDMQVQNRIIKVTVINGHGAILEEAAGQYLDNLRVNLGKMDYRLSGVSFVNPVNEKDRDLRVKLIPFSEAGSYSGVDIRI
ncbi:hypothetical protein [Peribacillus simplex]|uniref:Flagellar hook-length control protein-like C-terminal domain-containing protein n=1 Tax=Peribacillus simplex NBRC 15720 = DSM 1321 TaxID=1349754 RepID=A0A223EDB1_9BACI|nr:hypothetical protein [Peribacillus simplex]ASS93246.1 hypothetical protein BS1321_04275 [Peribacillus simplex NBRC 15720 = DSM 1321]MEC1399709.1 hypothetical protein [Peribacillus simplex]